MSSAAGKTPAPGQAAYSASKHALNGYFHTLRSEVCTHLLLLANAKFFLCIFPNLLLANHTKQSTPAVSRPP